MSIENTLERIATALEQIAGNHTRPVEGTDETPAPEKPKRAPSAAKASEPKGTSPTDASQEQQPSGEAETPSAQEQAASSSGETQSDLSYEGDVKPLILKVGGTKGRDAAIDLLGEFDVDKGDKLDPAQWPAFIARANEVLG